MGHRHSQAPENADFAVPLPWRLRELMIIEHLTSMHARDTSLLKLCNNKHLLNRRYCARFCLKGEYPGEAGCVFRAQGAPETGDALKN